MVGTNVGAGRHERARSIAWTAAVLSITVTGAIGFAAALWPEAWVGLFTTEPTVIAAGSAYLVRVAPFYVFTGLGMALFFASQGAGRMSWPFAAGVLRLITVIAVAGYWITGMNGSMTGLFWIVALSQAIFGGINAIGFANSRSWGRPPALRRLEPATNLEKA
jgi:Na+-driven multidrug efflux pump